MALCLLLSVFIAGAARAQNGPLIAVADRDAESRPANATDWFRRADDLTNIRLPGCRPFHMHVAFSAFRGIGSERRGQDAIQTGDGEYQETWISPQQWRREVTLGRYHAVEVRTDGVRKFQATSDYEPSRVLMLLDALLFPIPRNLVTPELNQKQVDWNIRDIGSGQVPYVLISGAGAAHIYVYGFLDGGMLFRSGRAGLLMNWSKPIRFGKYLVPAEIAISALGTDLLRATVSIEAIDGDRLENFDILGSPANPGATLRPLHWFDVESACLDSHRYDLPGDSLAGC